MVIGPFDGLFPIHLSHCTRKRVAERVRVTHRADGPERAAEGQQCVGNKDGRLRIASHVVVARVAHYADEP